MREFLRGIKQAWQTLSPIKPRWLSKFEIGLVIGSLSYFAILGATVFYGCGALIQ